MATMGTTIERQSQRGLPQGAIVALIAGGGSLPVDLAARLTESGQSAVILPIRGEANADERFGGLPCEPIALEEFGSLMSRLKRLKITHVLMAGTVERRPKIAAMRPHIGLLPALVDVARALFRGDDNLLRAVVGHIEKQGIHVISAQDIMPDLLANAGLIAGPKPARRDHADIAAGYAAAKAIGSLDIGQAAIAIGGRTIALEGVEGTEGLLERTVTLRSHGRLAGATGGVLVKCAKPEQEMRVDLPAIGPDTVDAAQRAGLNGIALEAGRSLILEREETLRRAGESKVFIYGVEAEDR
ncbi:MAG: LpxI family protein [Rhizobiaceae bacterium]